MTEFILLFADLRKVFGARLIGLAVIMTVVGMTEGLSIVLLLPLLARLGIANPANAQSLAGRWLDDLNTWIGNDVALLVILIVAAVVISSSLFIWQSWLLASASQQYARVWKERLLHAFFAARWAFISGHKSGELLNSVITEPGRLSAAAMNMAMLVSSAIISLVYVIYALLLSWRTTVVLLALSACLVLGIRRLYSQSRIVGGVLGPLNAKQQVVIGEFLQSAKLVKAAAIERIAIDRSTDVVREMEIAQRRAMFMPSKVKGIFEAVSLTMLVLLLVVSNQVIGASPANLLVVLALFLRLFPRITALQQYIHNVNIYAPAVLTLSSLCDQAKSMAELAPVPSSKGMQLPAHAYGIEVCNLITEFDGRPALDGVNLSIPIPGFIALLGPSGAGKSTLLNNLLRLVPWNHGDIRIGGVSLSDLDLQSWRHSIGYMPQETILFHASIRENVGLLKPDATADEVELACRWAQLDDFIDQTERGLDTVIGDQGIRLSGGQRQRLGLARALLCNPKLLLLDEATSALDADTEREILEQLRTLSKQLGVLFVTHRESVAAYADRAYVLDRGRIVAGQPSLEPSNASWARA